MFSKKVICTGGSLIAKERISFCKIPILRRRYECKSDCIIIRTALFFNGLTILKIKKPLEYIPKVVLQDSFNPPKFHFDIIGSLDIAKALNEDEKIQEKVKNLMRGLDDRSSHTLSLLIARLKAAYWYGGGLLVFEKRIFI